MAEAAAFVAEGQARTRRCFGFARLAWSRHALPLPGLLDVFKSLDRLDLSLVRLMQPGSVAVTAVTVRPVHWPLALRAVTAQEAGGGSGYKGGILAVRGSMDCVFELNHRRDSTRTTVAVRARAPTSVVAATTSVTVTVAAPATVTFAAPVAAVRATAASEWTRASVAAAARRRASATAAAAAAATRTAAASGTMAVLRLPHCPVNLAATATRQCQLFCPLKLGCELCKAIFVILVVWNCG